MLKTICPTFANTSKNSNPTQAAVTVVSPDDIAQDPGIRPVTNKGVVQAVTMPRTW